jgi:hypothetical protein
MTTGHGSPDPVVERDQVARATVERSHVDHAQRIAAATRALEPVLLETLALESDVLMDELATRFSLVPWDRESLVGGVQRRVRALFERRAELDPGPPVRIVERAMQPFESIEATLRALRRGRRVALTIEPGASERPWLLLRRVFEAPCPEALALATTADDTLEVWGVEPGRPRVALVQADGDAELAAYVLARGALRRTGLDPRGLHVAVVAGPRTTLDRHLRRLWSGVKFGPPDDPSSFAGPLPPQVAEACLRAWAELSAHPSLHTIVPGAPLQVASDPGRRYVAPALFRWTSPVLDDAEVDVLRGLACLGPMLIVVPASAERASAVFERFAGEDYRRTRIGEPPKGQPPRAGERVYTGALLVERLPPGLPEPRP